MTEHLAITDGKVTIRSPRVGDAAVLVAGRDAVFHRFLGPGAPDPAPTAVIEVDGAVVGWVDHDRDPEHRWLGPGEVNVGYHLFARMRGQGYTSRAVQLLMHRLALAGQHRAAALLIDADNHPSLALAGRLGFQRLADVGDQHRYRRLVPPLTYTDGAISIRRRRPEDLDQDLAAKDREQQVRMWSAEDRRTWAALDDAARRDHARRGLAADAAAFGHGPKWTFAVDHTGTPYVAYVDVDLANEHAPVGEANVACSTHPDHRGKGYATTAVRLAGRFLADHTGARTMYLSAATDHRASLAVIDRLAAAPVDHWRADGHTYRRHRLPVPRPALA